MITFMKIINNTHSNNSGVNAYVFLNSKENYEQFNMCGDQNQLALSGKCKLGFTSPKALFQNSLAGSATDHCCRLIAET